MPDIGSMPNVSDMTQSSIMQFTPPVTDIPCLKFRVKVQSAISTLEQKQPWAVGRSRPPMCCWLPATPRPLHHQGLCVAGQADGCAPQTGWSCVDCSKG